MNKFQHPSSISLGISTNVNICQSSTQSTWNSAGPKIPDKSCRI